MAETLASALSADICIKIFFGDDGISTHVELEECEGDEEELDEDFVAEES